METISKDTRKILKRNYLKDAQRHGVEAVREVFSINHLREDFSNMTEGELNERFPLETSPDMEGVAIC